MKNKKLRKASGGMKINGDFKAKNGISAEDNSYNSFLDNSIVRTSEKKIETKIGVQLSLPA